MRVRGAAVVALILLAAAAVTGPASAAPGPVPSAGVSPTTALDLGDANAMVAVPASDGHGAVLAIAGFGEHIPAGSYTGVLIVDPATGAQVQVPGVSYVRSVALGPTSRTVYAAMWGHALAVIDVDDPEHPTIVTLPVGICPIEVAVGGDGRAYVVSSCDWAKQQFVVIDPATATVRASGIRLAAAATASSSAQVTAAAGAPSLLALTEAGVRTVLLDTRGDRPSVVATITAGAPVSAQLEPDGATVLVGASATPTVQRYTVGADPQPVGAAIATGPSRRLVFSDDGQFFAASNSESSTYDAAGKALEHYAADSTFHVITKSLAWIGRDLFDLESSYDPNFPAPVLRRHADATLPATSLSVVVRTSFAVAGTPLQLTGQLSTADGVDRSDRMVTVTRTGPRGTTTTVATARTATDGSWTAQDVPYYPGPTTYTASVASDTTHGASSRSVWVDVAPHPTFLSIGTDQGWYRYGAVAHVTIHLGATASNRTVSLYSSVGHSDAARTLVSTRRVDADGKVHLDLRMTYDRHLTAVFAGDERYASASAVLDRDVAENLDASLQGAFAVDRYGRSLYHAAASSTVHVHVTPNEEGRSVAVELARWDGSAWRYLGTLGTPVLNQWSNANYHWRPLHFAGNGDTLRIRVTGVGTRLSRVGFSAWCRLRIVD